MAFFALWSWTDGFLLTPIATVLRIWFGWGSLFILLGIAYLGYVLLQRERTEIKWDRIIGLELASLNPGLVGRFSGNNLFRAESAWTVVAWAGPAWFLWQSMGEIVGTLVLLFFWALAIATGFGLWARAIRLNEGQKLPL